MEGLQGTFPGQQSRGLEKNGKEPTWFSFVINGSALTDTLLAVLREARWTKRLGKKRLDLNLRKQGSRGRRLCRLD